ncbi:hypothetical protein LTR62_002386 [Meristemomyces frigidus]|uniref:MI domain-containing protein n=1 Tax=Meristemomyces frigidus TaxID=1508187 RepID=A0AAN7TLZ6_9PEZI|nr:hypothetical protein LTR62_002386 [Meristemomyces frigidus]
MYRGPKLPRSLLNQVDPSTSKKGGKDVSRKDRRKAERQAKKGGPQPQASRDRSAWRSRAKLNTHGEVEREVSSTARERPSKDAKPTKSILKGSRTVAAAQPEPTPETEVEDSSEHVLDDEDGLSEVDSDDSFTISRQAAKAGLADEDVEIAALERKLGVRSKKSSNEIGDDELEWLVQGSDSEDGGRGRLKRKRPSDDAKWLRDKRSKTSAVEAATEAALRSEDEELENPFSEDELSEDDDFAEFGSEEGNDADTDTTPKRERENPYVAPPSVDSGVAAKYIPPSLRKAAASEDESLKQLRRQVQGQLNRLSDANLLTILQAVEQIYEKSARQHVTGTLIDLLVGLVTDPSILNDTFLILHAGFAAAVYKVVGTDFGAQLLEKLVDVLDGYRQDSNGEGKQQLNLVAFLSTLYAFQVISSAILFDYIRLLLTELTEDNTELLLRIIRTSGTQLRQDDPLALKDIVLLLQQQVNDAGEANISVRTKYMIDTIRDLKNNRMKTGVANSVIVAEHTNRMRKILGTLNTRPLRATEPLRITLADIRESSKKGKWWLVGASYHDPAKLVSTSSKTGKTSTQDDGYESETPGSVNLTKAARAHGMNTDIRRLIFINILGAMDLEDAYMNLQKLKLRTKQMAEVSRVIIHCAGVEKTYNPFYGFLALRLCENDGRVMQKAFRTEFWGVVKKVKSGDDDPEEEEDNVSDSMGLKKLVNYAKLFAFLIANNSLPLSAAKTLDFGLLQPDTKAHTFSEVLITTVLLQAHKLAKKNGNFEDKIGVIFGKVKVAPQMIADLLQFVEITVASADLAAGKKEKRTVREGCEIVLEFLRKMEEDGGGLDSGDEEEDGNSE